MACENSWPLSRKPSRKRIAEAVTAIGGKQKAMHHTLILSTHSLLNAVGFGLIRGAGFGFDETSMHAGLEER